jgi:hypothetical protein
LVGGIVARSDVDSGVGLPRPGVRGRGVLVTCCGWGFLGVFVTCRLHAVGFLGVGLLGVAVVLGIVCGAVGIRVGSIG